ncbi:zinc ribbon domain-containing protein [candidate division KSB1 bacterium]|nr:zinc ribbon domain-containing protein [candidate division KSB1 bacterium]RQW01998.1 MAG: zinc ribbon domain-containing protein [candidate division KSB1 bacterium]
MPTYDYRCGKCGHQFEVFQSITDNPLTECPSCGGSVERLISSGAGLVFKGSGFYVTDYKKSPESTKETKPADKKTAASSKLDD